ncbi:MAG: class I SAM-dependent methyltransferase [bacterium]|nr:class I SAM-dependent methyltransferase [bacterium]
MSRNETAVNPRGAGDKEEHEKRVGGIYSRRARNYKILHSLQTLFVDRYWRKETVKSFKEPVDTILELGTGSGLTAEQILNAGKAKKVIGVDINKDMLLQSRNNTITQGVYLPVNGNALELPFPDNSFEVVVSMLGLGGIYDIDQAFKEISRVIKNNGTLYSLEMCTPKKPFRRFLHNLLTKRIVDRYWGFKDIDIEGIIEKMNIKDYSLRYRKEMLLGSVYQLEAKIVKPDSQKSHD